MSPGLVIAVAVTAVLLVCVGVGLVRSRRTSRRLADRLAASREELAVVQKRLDALARRVDRAALADVQEYVITTAGPAEVRAPESAAPPAPMTGRQFASVALGESLVTVFSFGYGVRQALSAENRNRIRFEIRREVRRARKQRKRDLREAKRHVRASQREDAA